MRHLILLLLTPLVAIATTTANNRTLEQMRDFAATKLNRTTAVKGVTSKRVQPATLECVADDDTYAVFTPGKGADGFVIVAKSDLVDPLIGYSTKRFNADDMPAALKWYLTTVSRHLTDIENGLAKAPRRTAATFIPVENFVTTQWSQDYPFNQKTPSKYLSGCVATAMAQCLNYRQYPASVDFDGDYYVTKKVGKKETLVNQEEHVSTTYTWPYKDKYASFGKYDDNIDELLRDCGYATYMQYSEEGSGTSTYLSGVALVDVFGYPEESVKYYEMDCFGNKDEWNQIVYDELAFRSPIIYAAHDPSYEVGGHAFLFSGVDEEGLVYVNWGWRGSANGFYDIALLNPKNGGSTDHYTDYQCMVTGIRPTPLPTDQIQTRIYGFTGDPYTFRWGTETDDNGEEHHTLYADIPYGLINYCPSSFVGVFGIFAEDLTDSTTWVIEEELQDRDTIPAGYGWCSTDESYKAFGFYYYIDSEKGLKPGHTYRMSFGTKDDREGTWHSLLCFGGELAYDITYTGDPATSTVDPEVKYLTSAIHNLPAAVSDRHPAMDLWFDLSGRRVTQPSHGIYLRNGKKIVVR